MDLSIEKYVGQLDKRRGFFTAISTTLPISQSKYYEQKEVILILDLSRSMEPSLKILMASLKTFKDLLPEEIPLTIVGFNDESWTIFSPGEDFSKEIDNISKHCSGCTNGHSGLERAFSLKNPDRFTWFILMTDGDFNRGLVFSVNEISEFISNNKPTKSKIISLGYGKEYNPELLISIGEFTYIPTREKISPIFGAISSEITTSFGVEAKLQLSNTKDHNIIVGDQNIGILFSERKYLWLFFHKRSTKTKYTLEFFSFPHFTREIIDSIDSSEISFQMIIPSRIKSAYYNSAKGRRVKRIYENKRSINYILKDLESWEDEEAQSHKEEILELIKNQSNRHQLLQISSDCRNQSSYVDDAYYTPNQRVDSNRAIQSIENYLS